MIQSFYLSLRYTIMLPVQTRYSHHTCSQAITILLVSHSHLTCSNVIQSSYLFEYDTVILPVPTWYNHRTCSSAIKSSYLLPGDQTTNKEPQNLHTWLVDQTSFLSSFVGAVSVHYCLKRGNYPERLSVYYLSTIAWKRGDYPERLSVYYLSILAWKRGDYPEHLSVYYLSTVAWKGGITVNVCWCIICPLLLEKGRITLNICAYFLIKHSVQPFVCALILFQNADSQFCFRCFNFLMSPDKNKNKNKKTMCRYDVGAFIITLLDLYT